jgi:hypothetical protein
MMEAPHLPVTLLKPRHRNGPGGWGAQADRARPESPCYPMAMPVFYLWFWLYYTVGRERAEGAPYVHDVRVWGEDGVRTQSSKRMRILMEVQRYTNYFKFYFL